MKFTFKSFQGEKGSGAESSQTAQAKRKEQVRRAQKTHRERKEAYIKSLEQEVVQLRANEAKILGETRRLYSELTELKQLITKNGIEMPASQACSQPNGEIWSASASDEESFDLSIRITNTKQKRRQIQVIKPSSHSQHELAYSSKQSSQSPYPLSSPTTIEDLVSNPQSTQHVSDLDLTSLGMEFVLTLESPCLSHITDAPPNAETGHALMASATLLHQRHEHHYSDLHSHPPQTDWQVSAVGIEKLLQLSTSVPISEGELTPVQAWDALRQHPGFLELESTRLKTLMDTLVAGVKCYGFGGVIEQGAFENALFETFVIGRVF